MAGPRISNNNARNDQYKFILFAYLALQFILILQYPILFAKGLMNLLLYVERKNKLLKSPRTGGPVPPCPEGREPAFFVGSWTPGTGQ